LKKYIILSLILFLSVIIAVIGIWTHFKQFSETPVSEDNTSKTFIIKPGQSFNTTAGNLEKQQLVLSSSKFKIIARYLKKDRSIKAGEYLLSQSMNPLTILDILSSGKSKLYKLTVPEGLSMFQIAELVEASSFDREMTFIKYATDKMFLKKLGIQAETAEGYLFPETYYFGKEAKSEKIITVMIERFKKVFTPEFEKQAEVLGFTVHEIVTLASIIEKETGAAEERPVISSVFHNRMKKKMRLETDPTVIYGMTDFNGNITKKDLRTLTPYNTYMIKGLPPGPIANPGEAALIAALYPADTDYLFFVSKKDTTHQFSTNIRDHNKAVRKYQLRRKK